jgi:hypothetical protein
LEDVNLVTPGTSLGLRRAAPSGQLFDRTLQSWFGHLPDVREEGKSYEVSASQHEKAPRIDAPDRPAAGRIFGWQPEWLR